MKLADGKDEAANLWRLFTVSSTDYTNDQNDR